jgi:hypothetical protein
MSVSYPITISEQLAELVEQRRGVLSLQEFTFFDKRHKKLVIV